MAQQTADYQGQVVYGLTMGKPTRDKVPRKNAFNHAKRVHQEIKQSPEQLCHPGATRAAAPVPTGQIRASTTIDETA